MLVLKTTGISTKLDCQLLLMSENLIHYLEFLSSEREGIFKILSRNFCFSVFSQSTLVTDAQCDDTDVTPESANAPHTENHEKT